MKFFRVILIFTIVAIVTVFAFHKHGPSNVAIAPVTDLAVSYASDTTSQSVTNKPATNVVANIENHVSLSTRQ